MKNKLLDGQDLDLTLDFVDDENNKKISEDVTEKLFFKTFFDVVFIRCHLLIYLLLTLT